MSSVPARATSSSFTGPAFVHHGNWSAESDKHPAIRFIKSLAQELFDAPHDSANHADFHDYYAEDVTHITPYSESPDGGIAGFGAVVDKFYTGDFTRFRHVPYTLVAIETADGYDCHIQANIYANPADGVEGTSHEKVKDDEGREWDLRIPVFYEHTLVKVPGAPIEGLKLTQCTVIKDTDTWTMMSICDVGIEHCQDDPYYAAPQIYYDNA